METILIPEGLQHLEKGVQCFFDTAPGQNELDYDVILNVVSLAGPGVTLLVSVRGARGVGVDFAPVTKPGMQVVRVRWETGLDARVRSVSWKTLGIAGLPNVPRELPDPFGGAPPSPISHHFGIRMRPAKKG